MKKLVVFGGNSNPELLSKICLELEVDPGKALVSAFPDSEVKIEIEENVRGKDVFLVQSLSPPVNDNIMELLIMIDALRRASAMRITAVIPYFGYARQDRKHKGRVPISARLIADFIETAGADRVLTMDLHAPQIQGFFKIPVDHLPGYLAFEKSFEKYSPLTVVAPDAGSVPRALPFANRLNTSMAIIDKRRSSDKSIEVRNIIGRVKKMNVIIIDDIISTGGTMIKNIEALKEAGCLNVIICVTHGVFAPGSAKKFNNAEIEKVYITDSVKSPFVLPENVCVCTTAPFIAETIRRIHKDESVSEILDHT